jgi:hypothetical protein
MNTRSRRVNRSPVREQPLLHQILDAAGRERRAPALILRRQLLAEPSHRAIEVMQLEPVDAGDPVVFAPAIRRADGAADEQPVQNGARDRDTARATLGEGLAVSAFPRSVPV